MTQEPSSRLPLSVAEAIRRAFENGALISEPKAAELIGFSVSTLRREAQIGNIEYRLRGSRRCYAREDLEEYLTREVARRPAGDVSTSAKAKPRVNNQTERARSKPIVSAFSDARGKQLMERLRELKRTGGRPRREDDAAE